MSKLDNLKHLQIQQLKPVDSNHSDQTAAVKFSTNRYNQLEKFIRDQLQQDRSYFQGEKNTLSNVVLTLKDQSDKLANNIKVNREQKDQIEADLKISQSEVQRLQSIVLPHDEKQISAEIVEIKKKIVASNKMRLDEAIALNINDLKTLTIKNKDKESPVNELWVWVLVVIYKEPASSYYWLNFKEQVLEKPEGAQDFKDRLGRVKAIDMKKDEYERTQNLLKQKDKILGAEIVTPLIKAQIQNIFKIVNLMMEVEEFGNKIHTNEKLLQKLAAQRLQIDSDTQKNQEKSKILQDRIQFLDVIFHGYVFMNDTLLKKIASYQQAQLLNDKFTEAIESSYNQLDFSKSYAASAAPAVETVQHQQIAEAPLEEVRKYDQQLDDQIAQMQQQEPVQEEQQHQHQQQQQFIEVQQTPEENQINLQQEPPITEIAQTKTGGCEACNIF